MLAFKEVQAHRLFLTLDSDNEEEYDFVDHYARFEMNLVEDAGFRLKNCCNFDKFINR